MEKLSLVRAIWSVPSASWTRWGEGPVFCTESKDVVASKFSKCKTCTEHMAHHDKLVKSLIVLDLSNRRLMAFFRQNPLLC